MTIPEKTRSDLEWPALLEAIARRCASEASARRAEEIDFFDSQPRAFAHMRLVQEFVDRIDDDDPPPPLDACDVGNALAHMASDGTVFGDSFVAIASNLRRYVALWRFVDNRKDVCPQNAMRVLPRDSDVSPTALSRLIARIDEVFESDGSVREDASPRLLQLRHRVLSLRASLLERLEEIALAFDDVVRDRTITMRNERYVIPVRRDAHMPIDGIVHGASSSGATVYVEPSVCVTAGNDLTIAREEVTQEEVRIRQALRAEVRERLPDVVFACDTIVDVDVTVACAKFSWEIDAAIPGRSSENEMVFKEMRHPLLCLQIKTIIPNSATIKAGETLLISGPNAGGKTVLLKTVGLCCLMLKAGLPIPALPESTVYIPDLVLSDIGDEQSITSQLSTFSGHMQNISRIFDMGHSKAVVLLDELCNGTDPVEGTALARAILDSLNRIGAATVATTHYNALKAHARASEGFVNGGMGFDGASMGPTYQLKAGEEGRSSAFSTALKYGLSPLVVDRAREYVPDDVRRMAKMVERVEAEQAALAQEKEALRKAVEKARATESTYQKKIDALERRDGQFVNRETEVLWGAIRKARQTVRDVEKSVRRSKKSKELVAATARVNEIAAALAPGERLSADKASSLPGTEVGASDLRCGERVYVVSTQKEGVVDSDPRGNTVYVRIGALRMRVSVADVRLLTSPPATQPTSSYSVKYDAARPVSDSIRTRDNTLDLRGNRVDEGIDAAGRFMDDALCHQQDVIYILTGWGTGALTRGIRDYLRGCPYVERFRPGNEDEGGDAVTAVYLR